VSVEAAAPSPTGRSGRRVILAIVLGVPLVLVPVLLTGRASKAEVCLNTLARRDSADLAMGSFPLVHLDAREVDAWPAPPTHPHLLDRVGPLPTATPAEWHRAMGASPETFFMAVERTMPFAFVVQIPNTRALAPSRAAIVEVRLLAAATLDPADADDRECWAMLDARLREGLERLANLKGRERRHPPLTAGEKAAQETLARCLDAMDRAGDDRGVAVRAALCAE